MFFTEYRFTLPQRLQQQTSLQNTINQRALHTPESLEAESFEQRDFLPQIIDLSAKWEHSVSPFYTYTLEITGPTEAILQVAPRKNVKAASNRFHSIVTEDGTILSQRGRREYRILSNATTNAHEFLGIATSAPQKGRRVSREFDLIAAMNVAVYPTFSDQAIFTQNEVTRFTEQFLGEVLKDNAENQFTQPAQTSNK